MCESGRLVCSHKKNSENFSAAPATFSALAWKFYALSR
jgi:hypothetical protein